MYIYSIDVHCLGFQESDTVVFANYALACVPTRCATTFRLWIFQFKLL